MAEKEKQYTLAPLTDMNDPGFKAWYEALKNGRLDTIKTNPTVFHNVHIPDGIDRGIHWHDMDTGELYRAYQKISQIIDRMTTDSSRPHSRSYGEYSPKWGIGDLREYCQGWLDDVRYRQDGNNGDRWWVFDRIRYFMSGKYRKRIHWLRALGVICYDMCTRLDEIDGGQTEQPNIPGKNKTIGF